MECCIHHLRRCSSRQLLYSLGWPLTNAFDKRRKRRNTIQYVHTYNSIHYGVVWHEVSSTARMRRMRLPSPFGSTVISWVAGPTTCGCMASTNISYFRNRRCQRKSRPSPPPLLYSMSHRTRREPRNFQVDHPIRGHNNPHLRVGGDDFSATVCCTFSPMNLPHHQ